PSSAGVVIDAVRCAKLGRDRELAGELYGPSSYFKKSPPEQYTDEVARRKVEAFIAGTENQTTPERAVDSTPVPA
ncbi:inositol-3-phosphate synthase, partial [Litorilinea aerophila]